jgi:hypothetical protein
MLLLSVLMVSHVLYPVVPKLQPAHLGRARDHPPRDRPLVRRSPPRVLLLPGFAILYITYGLVRSVVLGFLERLPERDPLDRRGRRGRPSGSSTTRSMRAPRRGPARRTNTDGEDE